MTFAVFNLRISFTFRDEEHRINQTAAARRDANAIDSRKQLLRNAIPTKVGNTIRVFLGVQSKERIRHDKSRNGNRPIASLYG